MKKSTSKTPRSSSRAKKRPAPKRQFHSWSEIKAKAPLPPEAAVRSESWVAEQIVQLNLQALRKQLGVTQSQVAAATGFAQGEISRIEQRDDHMVSTLRRVVRALGGELEVHARFPDGRDIRLVGV